MKPLSFTPYTSIFNISTAEVLLDKPLLQEILRQILLSPEPQMFNAHPLTPNPKPFPFTLAL
jgi:hypothetical protein